MTKAIRDTTREDGGVDVQKALTYLSLLPHSPNESIESVGEIFDRGWTFRVGDAMMWLVPQPDRKHIEIVWWLPLALWTSVAGLEVMIEACEAVLAEYGLEARTWDMGGIFSAQGSTPDELLAASQSIAEIHTRSWIPSLRLTRAPDTNYIRGDDSVAHMLDLSKAWNATRRD